MFIAIVSMPMSFIVYFDARHNGRAQCEGAKRHLSIKHNFNLNWFKLNERKEFQFSAFVWISYGKNVKLVWIHFICDLWQNKFQQISVDDFMAWHKIKYFNMMKIRSFIFDLYIIHPSVVHMQQSYTLIIEYVCWVEVFAFIRCETNFYLVVDSQTELIISF